MTTVTDPFAEAALLREATSRPARWRPTAALSQTLAITEGQAATMLVALAVGLVLTAGSLPPVLRHRSVQEEQAANSAPPAAAPLHPAVPATPAASSPALAAPQTDAPAYVAPSAAFELASGSPSQPAASLGAPTPALGSMALFARVGSPGAPHGLAVDGDGVVYVATNNGASQGEAAASRILTFASSGAPGREYTITGQPAGHALGLTGLALDGHGGIVALDAATARVLRIDLRSAAQTTLSELPDLPVCPLVVAPNDCEFGIEDDGPQPRGLALDPGGDLLVTDGAQGVVWRVRGGGGKPTLWASSASFGDGLTGIAFDAQGSVLVTTPSSLDPDATLGGAVYRLPIDGDGNAGPPQLVASFPAEQEPAGIATVSDGSLVVALRGAAAVVLLDPDGREVRRVSGTAGGVALDAPTEVAFLGPTLLATNQAPARTEAWAVLAIGIR